MKKNENLKELNDKQRKLIEENHNLIYSFMNSKHLIEDNISDWYGTCAVALCKAALTFDESLGFQFSTYAYKCMNKEVSHVLRQRSIQSACSLDDFITEEKDLTLGEIIADKHNRFDDMELRLLLDRKAETLPKHKKAIIIDCIYSGLTQTDIAAKYGITRQRVSKIYQEFIDKIRPLLNEREVVE